MAEEFKKTGLMDGMGENNGREDDSTSGSPLKYRLPFGLCKKYGIAIQDWWAPHDAWDALKGYNIEPDEEYDKLDKNSEDSGSDDVPNFDKDAKISAAESIDEHQDNPYSDERKNNAIWCKNGKESIAQFAQKSIEIYNNAPESEKKAAWAYTAGSGKFNRPLRGYEGDWGKQYYKGAGNVDLDREGAGKDIEELTKLIDKSSFEEDIWLQRGVNFDGAKAFTQKFGHWDEDAVNALVGRDVSDLGFLSCGAAKGTGFKDDVIFNIYCPKGTKMLYAEPFSAFGNNGSLSQYTKKAAVGQFASYENEMILQRGLKYKITKAEKATDGKYYIDMEVHND